MLSPAEPEPFSPSYMKPFRCLPRRADRCIAFLALVVMLMAACSDEPGPGRSSVSRKIIGGDTHLFATEDFTRSLVASLRPVDTTDSLYKKQGLRTAGAGMWFVYQSAGYRPLWVAENGVTEAAASLLKDLDSLYGDGIDPARYRVKELSAAMADLKSDGNPDKAIAFDTACTKAWLQASRDLLLGVMLPRRADSLWYHANDSAWSAPHALVAFAGSGLYPPLAAYRSGIPTYRLLQAEYARYNDLSGDTSLISLKSAIRGKTLPDSIAAAIISGELPWIQPAAGDSLDDANQRIRGFQERYGLAPTGKADSNTVKRLRMMPDTVMRILAANMERLRWMPRSLEPQYVLVDIPLMELFYRRDGNDAFHMRVVVGKPSRQTPALNAAMSNIVFSPAWGVPPTILKQDVLPGICKRGGAYLAHKGLHAYDRCGRMVSAAVVTAKNYRNYDYRQPPGERNALGDVKFNLPNKWDIYLHDTPHREDFPKRYRAKSSGCVRVERPHEFAGFILSEIEGRERFDQYTIDSIILTRKTRFEPLKHKIPVHIVYLTAFEDSTGSHIRLLPDIYGKDTKLIAALNGIGRIN